MKKQEKNKLGKKKTKKKIIKKRTQKKNFYFKDQEKKLNFFIKKKKNKKKKKKRGTRDLQDSDCVPIVLVATFNLPKNEKTIPWEQPRERVNV
jgi:hypothetical protein